MPMDPLATLIALGRRRWALPALAELHRAGGLKFITLVNSLGASRPAAREALDHLIALGLATPNPGYGHPLRPEYILTPRGRALGPACIALHDLARRLGLAEVLRRRWSLAVLAAIRAGRRRFSELKAYTPTLTDRALALALKDLLAAGLIARRLIDGAPPSAAYQPTRRATPLLAAIGNLSS
ncbi:MAG: winged helix-turn-helix transcriptional regulator [Phycisphaerales bacterium]